MNYMIKNMNPNEILIYLRKSRKDYEFVHEDIEKTLERHEKILQDYAYQTFNEKIPESNIYREVVSGDTIVDRPKMQEVLSLIEQDKYKAVLVLEIERLARGNTIDQGVIAQTFQLTNTLIVTPQKIYNLDDEMDRSFFEDGLFQSRKYLLYTKKILSRGRIQSVSEGKAVMSTTPFGYDKEKLKGEKGFKLVINEQEAEIIKIIYEKFLNEDLGTSKIAHYLNSIGAKARKSKIWTPAMVRNIIMNISITGKVTWNHRKTITQMQNGQIVKTRPINNDCLLTNGLHEAIIQYDTWLKAQQKLKRLHVVKAPTTIQNPLAGIIYCKICGRSMIRRPYPDRKDSIMCPLAKCQNVSSDLDLVEKRIIEELNRILKEYKNVVHRDKIENKKNYSVLIDNIKKEIESLKKQLQKACEMLELDVYSINEFNERKQTINSEIEIKNKALKLLIEEQSNFDIKKYEILIPNIESVLNLYTNQLTAKEKNDLLKSLIENVHYLKLNKGRWNKDFINNFAIEIELKI